MSDAEMLERLVRMFWWSSFNKHLEWSYQEGFGISSFDSELEKALIVRFRIDTK